MKITSHVLLCCAWLLLLPLNAQGTTDLPPEFGQWVPVYPGALVTETRYTREGVSVVFLCEDDYGQVVDFYSKTLPKKGWRVHPATAAPKEGAPLRYTRDNVALTLSEASEALGHGPGFVIRLHYPGGRD